MPKKSSTRNSFGSVSLVRQGSHRFYSLTLPSDVLAKVCYVINREEDQLGGFQRTLDEKRAMEIANYIDNENGTIPSAIVLSAQGSAMLKFDGKKKSISFDLDNKAFLILDGQHRVFGFIKARTSVRVPVVIYPDLSRRDETRLFIDINSKQKGVPPELLLDIKQLAEYESDDEQLLRDIFDLFHAERASSLGGRLSPAKKEKGKISRSVFNRALKPLLPVIGVKGSVEAFKILNAYYVAFSGAVLEPLNLEHQLFSATVFRAVSAFFSSAASRVKDRHGPIYSADNFFSVLEVVGSKTRRSAIESPGQAYKPLVKSFEVAIDSDFQL